MFSRWTKTAAAAALIMNGTWVPAHASDLGAAIVGGIIGGAIVGSANQQKKRSSSSSTRSSTSSAYSVQRQQNREMQASLNYFGFDAGPVDGQVGRKTRAAIADYQRYMGYEGTGTLTSFQQSDRLFG